MYFKVYTPAVALSGWPRRVSLCAARWRRRAQRLKKKENPHAVRWGLGSLKGGRALAAKLTAEPICPSIRPVR